MKLIDDDSSLPVRKIINHRGPTSLDIRSAWYFITLCAANHNAWSVGGDLRAPRDSSLDTIATAILNAARYYHDNGKWKLSVFLVMPDHLHFIVHVPTCADGGGTPSLPNVIRHWKHYVTEHYGIRFQRDFFDTRIRDDAHYAEKFRYICQNPVRKGLCTTPREWQHVIAFDCVTGEERIHL